MQSNLREAQSYYSELMGLGEQIASTNNHVLYENARTGERLTVQEALSGLKDNHMRAMVALLMENTRREFQSLDEATRLMNIGSFEKYAFPMVRVVLPSLVAHNLVSVQPMAGPTSLVFYMRFLYNRSKGTAVGGKDMVENPNFWYSSEFVDSEVVGLGTGAQQAFTPNLAYTPIKPGTVKIVATITGAEVEITDDGNGKLTGAALAGPGTINYAIGATSFTYTTAPDAATNLVASYNYDLEGNAAVPEVDLSLVSTPVQAITRKLRSKWSLEAQADFRNIHGLEAELELVAAIANEIKFEVDREVVTDLKKLATNTNPTGLWSKTPGAGISYTEHKLSFVDEMIKCSNEIYRATQRAVGTWAICGLDVATIIESLPGFKPSGVVLSGTRGVYHAGTLNGRWEIFKDANYTSTEYLVGYKGETMWETGYIYAPYVPIYTTPTVMLDDFMGRKGIASRYGKKMVDGRFYCKGGITA
jgi:hypothetical protein